MIFFKKNLLRLLCCLSFFILSGSLAFGQPVYQWVNKVSSNSLDEITAHKVDASGNIYVAGMFGGTVDFDPSGAVFNLTPSTGPYNTFIAKYNNTGGLVWAKALNGNGYTRPKVITFDPSGNVLIAGDSYFSSIDFDPSPSGTAVISTGLVYLAKYDINGNYIWVKSFGSGSGNQLSVTTVEVDNTGEIFISGSLYGSNIDFDPSSAQVNLSSPNHFHLFFGKYDSNGNYIWVSEIGDPGTLSVASGLKVNASGNVILSGYYYGTADFDPSSAVFPLTSVGGSNSFIAEYTPAGSLNWIKDLDGEFIRDMVLDPLGNIIVAGRFDGTRDFDPSSSVANLSGVQDVFLAKYSATGIYSWAKGMEGSDFDDAIKIAYDNSGYYLLGNFISTVDFDPSAASANLTSVGLRDLFMAKYDASGNYNWAVPIGSPDDEWTANMSFTNGNLYLSGRLMTTIDVDPSSATVTISPNNTTDGYLVKYYVCTMPAATGTITAPATICTGTGQNFSVPATAGATNYTWTVPTGVTITSGQGTTNAVLDFTNTGNHEIKVMASNGCGNATISSLTVSVNSVPGNTGTISGLDTPCEGTTQTYSIPTDANTTSHTWTVPSGSTILSGGTTNSISLKIGATSGTISVTRNNACGSGTAITKTITVTPKPGTPGPISGIFSVQQGATGQVFSIAPVTNATSYTWSVPSGSTIVSGQGTNSITVNVGTTSGSIIVRPVGCVLGTTSIHHLDVYSCPDFLNYTSANKVATSGQGSYGQQIKTDATGNMVTMGTFGGTIDLDLTASVYNLTSVTTTDMYLAKYNAAGNLLWAYGTGTTNAFRAITMQLDNSGNIYVTGYFSGTVDFDPTASVYNLTASSAAGNGWDCFVAKYNSSGNLTWANAIHVNNFDNPTGVAVDNSGNVFVSGNSLVNAFTSANIFLAKFNSSGVTQWTNVLTGTTEVFFSNRTPNANLHVDYMGNIYMLNSFSGTVDFDPSPSTFNLTSAGSTDIAVTKYSTSGALLLAKAIGGTGKDIGYSITTLSFYFFAITGSFNGTADVDPSANTSNLVSAGGSDIFFAIYTTSGGLYMARSVGSTLDDIGYDLTLDNYGNLYVTGHFFNTVDFDPGAGTANLVSSGASSPNIFIAKYSYMGDYLWAKKIGGGINDQPMCYDLHKNGNTLYLSGSFVGTVDFDPSASVANLVSVGGGFPEAFLAKYSECPSGIRVAEEEFVETESAEVNKEATGWTIYPNPGNEEIFLHASMEEAEYELCELSGTIVTKGNLKNGVKSIPTSHLSAGTYLVKLGNKNTGYTYKKVVIVH